MHRHRHDRLQSMVRGDMTDDRPAFEPLVTLFKGDRERIRRTLDIFLRVIREDLQHLDGAYARHDWMKIAGLMHRMKSACLQIGERNAAEAAEAVERALHDADARMRIYAAAREALGHVEGRVARHLALGH